MPDPASCYNTFNLQFFIQSFLIILYAFTYYQSQLPCDKVDITVEDKCLHKLFLLFLESSVHIIYTQYNTYNNQTKNNTNHKRIMHSPISYKALPCKVSKYVDIIWLCFFRFW